MRDSASAEFRNDRVITYPLTPSAREGESNAKLLRVKIMPHFVIARHCDSKAKQSTPICHCKNYAIFVIASECNERSNLFFIDCHKIHFVHFFAMTIKIPPSLPCRWGLRGWVNFGLLRCTSLASQ